ncbi:hypothetical protein M758_1G014600 [Ceratodon purpureus]|uniref:Uncharacterized protein n=1 Tax=Ceratodon purpureus TaxID=3225 RepID=A0A8T0J3K1_CERPU|nr:hypothetical protein KC19_1G015300 [Ceratodon purpureus]KAG0628274.1 hypothetical protein M758_1G014600 [Ceratodon purpureus]
MLIPQKSLRLDTVHSASCYNKRHYSIMNEWDLEDRSTAATQKLCAPSPKDARNYEIEIPPTILYALGIRTTTWALHQNHRIMLQMTRIPTQFSRHYVPGKPSFNTAT